MIECCQTQSCAGNVKLIITTTLDKSLYCLFQGIRTVTKVETETMLSVRGWGQVLCRIIGVHIHLDSSTMRALATRGGGTQEVDSAGQVLHHGKPGVGECSLRSWGPQALGHPGAARCHRRAENGVGVYRVHLT